jgi:hypothetical protein
MIKPEDMSAMISYVHEQRTLAGLAMEPFEVIHGGVSSGIDREADGTISQSYAEVGVTWWLEMLVPDRWGTWDEWPLAAMRQRIRQGPPRPARHLEVQGSRYCLL